jgi:CH-like domain in sperm protein
MENSRLNPYELEAILKWIDGFTLSRSSKKLCRDFSDALLLAEILKYELPKLVDMHNYTACNSIQGKMKNWSTLNRKVLKKLNIHLREEEIERLAKAEMNCIEEVLFNVMNRVRVAKSCENDEESLAMSAIGKKADIMTVTIRRQVGDHFEHVPQQMIPYSLYEELQQKCEAQQSINEDLEARIDDLQNAIQSKNLIIADLEERLEKRHKKSNQPLSISAIKDSIANLF